MMIEDAERQDCSSGGTITKAPAQNGMGLR